MSRLPVEDRTMRGQGTRGWPADAAVEERRELRRIGANLNQVARRLNAGLDADALAVLGELNAWIVARVSRPR